MLIRDGKEVYPLQLRKMQLGEQTVYDRDTRGRSWLIIDLRLPGEPFIPADADGLITADGELFYTYNRRL